MFGVSRPRLPDKVADRAIAVLRSSREPLDYRQSPRSEARLRMRARRPGDLAGVLLLVPWTAFSVFWTVLASRAPFPFMLWGLPFVGLGIWGLVKGTNDLFERTDVEIADGILTRRAGALLSRRVWCVPIDDIAAVVVDEEPRSDRAEPVRTIRARLRSGEAIDLFHDVGSEAHALQWARAVHEELHAPQLPPAA